MCYEVKKYTFLHLILNSKMWDTTEQAEDKNVP